MNILLKIVLIVLAIFLCVISFGVLFPFLQSIGLFYDLGGHGLGNLGYIFYGALFGAIVGLVLSTYIVFKKTLLIKQFFISLAVFTIIITSIVFMSVNFLGTKW